ncbi:MAG: hypothetical protein AMXMBFR13_01180 [Phycisphaerae bacterium]
MLNSLNMGQAVEPISSIPRPLLVLEAMARHDEATYGLTASIKWVSATLASGSTSAARLPEYTAFARLRSHVPSTSLEDTVTGGG